MNLSQNPSTVCLRLQLPKELALLLAGAMFAEVTGRHVLEKALQNYFYQCEENAFISEGGGTLGEGNITLLTDTPARTLGILMHRLEAFPPACPADPPADLLPHVQIGLFDPQDNIFRTFHPVTTRPFWTLLTEPQEIDALLKMGNMTRLESTIKETP